MFPTKTRDLLSSSSWLHNPTDTRTDRLLIKYCIREQHEVTSLTLPLSNSRQCQVMHNNGNCESMDTRKF